MLVAMLSADDTNSYILILENQNDTRKCQLFSDLLYHKKTFCNNRKLLYLNKTISFHIYYV